MPAPRNTIYICSEYIQSCIMDVGSKNFRSPPQKDFCNNIDPKRTLVAPDGRVSEAGLSVAQLILTIVSFHRRGRDAFGLRNQTPDKVVDRYLK
jgi:hypothetical protein